MEEVVWCNVCGWKDAWTTLEAARSAGVWHVYDNHPAQWIEVVGNRPPQNPRPETQGRRYEEWERQS